MAESMSRISRVMLEVLSTLGAGLDLSVIGVALRAVVPRPSARQTNLTQAIEALRQASALVQDLEMELELRTSQLVELQSAYEHYSQLTAVEEDKARALLGEVEKSVGRGRRRDYAIALVINVVVAGAFFVLGVLVAR